MKYDLSYYVLTSGYNNVFFLQLITFLLTTVSVKVSAVGDSLWKSVTPRFNH